MLKLNKKITGVDNTIEAYGLCSCQCMCSCSCTCEGTSAPVHYLNQSLGQSSNYATSGLTSRNTDALYRN
ncbi:MAG: hypothetical protein K0S47_303 [Herbinix sp.]|jgi:putative bacteriocin precursor|nr:hypothetical protein [Herbinix sp.]